MSITRVMLISIEGNIGAGKSTILAAIAQRLGDRVSVHPEPVSEWADLLQRYYVDPRNTAFRLALKILLCFCDDVDRLPHDKDIHVFERSPNASKCVFAAMNRDDGDMSAREWDVLCKLHADLAWVPDLVIFIDVPSHVCCERVSRRARPCEAEMTTQYVRRVEHAYKKFIDSLSKDRVVRVDGAGTQDDVCEAVCKIICERLLPLPRR